MVIMGACRPGLSIVIRIISLMNWLTNIATTDFYPLYLKGIEVRGFA
ncbi:unnamed protein product [Brassica rapa subsp. trilocularis]